MVRDVVVKALLAEACRRCGSRCEDGCSIKQQREAMEKLEKFKNRQPRGSGTLPKEDG